MARLPGFRNDYNPAQGRGSLCGPAAMVCAGRYLGAPTALGIADRHALKAFLRDAGFGGGCGAQKLADLAPQLGLRARPIEGGLQAFLGQVSACTRSGRPVLVQWRPEALRELGDRYGEKGHWGMVVEWPDGPVGGLELSDSLADDEGERSGPQPFPSVRAFLERGGVTSRAPAVEVWLP
jgi:hypothetical protein